MIVTWTDAKNSIENLTRGHIDDLTEEQARELYRLALYATHRTGESPSYLVEQAHRIIRSTR